MNPTPTSELPSYQEILTEIAKHLGERRGLILKRAALIVWPAILVGVIFYLFQYGIEHGIVKWNEYVVQYILGFSVAAFLAALYYSISSIIFSIEKRVWIDAHFDKQHLLPKQSWDVACSLFLPTLRLGLEVFVRFYVLPILLFIIAFGSALLFIFNGVDGTPVVGEYKAVSGIVAMVIICFVTIVYFYFLRIRLRFLWFILLDRHGAPDFRYSALFREMKELNDVQKTDSFKKALVAQFGSDVIHSVVTIVVKQFSAIISSIGHGVGQAGMTGLGAVIGAVSVVTRGYGEEVSKQFTSYGKIIAFYLLYKQARQIKYGEAQVQNRYYTNQ